MGPPEAARGAVWIQLSVGVPENRVGSEDADRARRVRVGMTVQ